MFFLTPMSSVFLIEGSRLKTEGMLSVWLLEICLHCNWEKIKHNAPINVKPQGVCVGGIHT